MAIKLILTLIFSLSTTLCLAADLIDLSANQLMTMQKDNALVIDIRTEKEWNETGIIPGSHKLQFFSSTGDYDLDAWLASLDKLKTKPDQPVILVCRSGNRTRMLGSLLAEKLEIKNIHHLTTGVKKWINNGYGMIKE